MSSRISQRELETYLWGAAVILRGLIDAGDYKQYIFPLVFLKRISDVYDEEHVAAMEVYGDEELADLPENHRFAIPAGSTGTTSGPSPVTLARRSSGQCAPSSPPTLTP